MRTIASAAPGFDRTNEMIAGVANPPPATVTEPSSRGDHQVAHVVRDLVHVEPLELHARGAQPGGAFACRRPSPIDRHLVVGSQHEVAAVDRGAELGTLQVRTGATVNPRSDSRYTSATWENDVVSERFVHVDEDHRRRGGRCGGGLLRHRDDQRATVGVVS